MTTIINASSVNGVTITSDTSGQLAFQSNGSTVATISAGAFSATGVSISSYSATGTLITSGTAQTTTSGTSIDFTSIPSWVKRVTVTFIGVSTSGTSFPQIQLGSGSATTTGYLTSYAYNGTTQGSSTTGFYLPFNAAADTRHGSYTFNLSTGNTWAGTGLIGLSNTGAMGYCAGSIALSGVLDRVRITTVNGTDTFDAGSINILYE